MNDYDDRLSCDHLKAEHSVNDARILELTHERKQADMNNVGMLLVGPLFMDLSSSEKTEATALVKRDAVLDQLIAARCGLKVQADVR